MNEEILYMVLDDTAEEEYVKKYGKSELPKTKEDEKIFEDLKRRLKNGDFDLK
ncbi:MAG: valine--tRNA ligase [Ruminococcaceae bacterium]|nr:valine--tRNA ligase [Oscillospiraceae bacterium]